MILVHSPKHADEIAGFLVPLVSVPVVIVHQERDILPSVTLHHPRVFLLDMEPAGRAVEVQAFLRERNPRCRVRILPLTRGGDLLAPAWHQVAQKVVKPFLKAAFIRENA